ADAAALLHPAQDLQDGGARRPDLCRSRDARPDGGGLIAVSQSAWREIAIRLIGGLWPASSAVLAPRDRCARRTPYSRRHTCGCFPASVPAPGSIARRGNAGRARRTASCPRIARAPRSTFPWSRCPGG